jgi:hypothetical protein
MNAGLSSARATKEIAMSSVSAELEAENAALRARVAELERELYALPPPEPEPEPAKPRHYILAEFPKLPASCEVDIGRLVVEYARRCQTGVEWVVVHRLEDVPVGEMCVPGADLLRLGFIDDGDERKKAAVELRFFRRPTG